MAVYDPRVVAMQMRGWAHVVDAMTRASTPERAAEMARDLASQMRSVAFKLDGTDKPEVSK